MEIFYEKPEHFCEFCKKKMYFNQYNTFRFLDCDYEVCYECSLLLRDLIKDFGEKRC